jgi:hypothetical protein
MGFPWGISNSWDTSREEQSPKRRKSISLAVGRILASDTIQSGNNFPLAGSKGADSGLFTGDAFGMGKSSFGIPIAKRGVTD